MKIIKAFREKENAMFLDLTDARAAVCIDKETGHIQFNEGSGKDRYDGIAARASSFKKFQILGGLKPKPGKVLLHFAGQTHLLGVTIDVHAALQWTERATALLRSKQAVETPRQKPAVASKSNLAVRPLAKSA
jgi:hypothetical protein